MKHNDSKNRTRGKELSLAGTLILLFLLASPVAGQQKQVTGTVSDAQGPMAGVAVSVKGASRGVSTDPQGKYTISAQPQDLLQFSFMGYETQEVSVADRNTIDVLLEENVSRLDEVVVIGYGTVRKRDLTGAVSSVKQEDITLSPVTNAMEALQGKIAGMDITISSGQAGSTPDVLLRGNRSLTAKSNPLYIIDGIAGDINNLNPNDIESIDVLKDASSTAIYGSAGANGVILVTTKRAKSGRVQIDFDTYLGINGFASYPSPLTGDKWLDYKKEAFFTGYGYKPDDLIELGLTAAVVNAIEAGQWVDWVDETLKIGTQQNYSVSVRGGSEKTMGYFSAGYMSEKGIYQNDRQDTYTLRAGVDNKMTTWLKAGVQTYLTWKDRDVMNSRINKAYGMLPLGVPYNEDGSINIYPVVDSGEVSPIANYAPGVYVSNRKSMNTRVSPYIELSPIEGLTIRSVFSADLFSQRNGNFENENSYNNLSNSLYKKTASFNVDFNYSYTWENIVTYGFKIGTDHDFGLTGITSWNDSRKEKIELSGEGFDYDEYLYYNMKAADNLTKYNTNYSGTKMLSFAGRINYNYKGRYLLNISSRWDGASQLADHWDVFPAAAFAWRISDEAFMDSTRGWLDNLKLRVGYGVTGNSSIDAYSSKTEVETDATNMTLGGASKLPLYVLTQAVGNPALTWEKSYNWNIGLDVSLFDSRIDLALEWYDTYTDGVLWSRSLPYSSGGYNAKDPYKMTTNIAETTNRGIEITVNSRNIVRPKFFWESAFTFARNKEQLKSIDLGNMTVDELISENLFVGSPIKSVYGLKKTGIWQLGQEEEAELYGRKPGQIRIQTVEHFDEEGNGDGGVHVYDLNKDRQILGSETPDWTLGFQNSFFYKNFDLNVFITMRWGQILKSQLLGYWKSNGATIPETYDYWTPTNPTNDFPRPGVSTGDDITISSLSLVEGSYMKIKNITLGYTLPSHLSEKVGLSRVRIYGTMYNPFIITKSSMLKGVDPESGGSDSFPLYKRIVFGINLSF